jgi:hypothetical protein
MAKTNFQATFKSGKKKISVSLNLYIWDEEAVTFVYSPSLDLTGYGYNELEAKSSFEIVLEDFVNYTSNKNTVFDELERLGWTVNRKKKRVNAPNLEELKADNSTFKNLLNHPNVRQENKNVQLAF